MSGRVKVSVDLPDIAGVMFESEREVLDNFGQEATHLAASQWVGWKYAGAYPDEQKGTSGASWGYELIDLERYERGLSLINDAEIQPRTGTKANGEPYSNRNVGAHYAAHVRRSGETRREWEVVLERIQRELLPGAVAELRDAILSNAGRDRVIIDLEPHQLSDVEVFDL